MLLLRDPNAILPDDDDLLVEGQLLQLGEELLLQLLHSGHCYRGLGGGAGDPRNSRKWW
jgi:hypothetical protein